MLHHRQMIKLSSACSASQPRRRSTVQMHVLGLGLPLETKTIPAVTTCEMLTGDEKDSDWRGTAAMWIKWIGRRQDETLASTSDRPPLKAWHLLESNLASSIAYFGHHIFESRRVPLFLSIYLNLAPEGRSSNLGDDIVAVPFVISPSPLGLTT